jgi:phosphoserine aminotransferase
VAKYPTKLFHSMPVQEFSVNMDAWKKLPEDLKALLSTATREWTWDQIQRIAVDDVRVAKELAAKGDDKIPTMLQYRTYVDENSLFNTPPTWGIYIFGETMKWVKKMGKENLFKLNAEKAKKIYDVIDSSDFWTGTAVKEFRSNMNVTWRIKNGDEALEKKFIDEAKAAGMSSLKGHRSVGGIRASIYNAFPMEGVDALVSFMKDFEKKNG